MINLIKKGITGRVVFQMTIAGVYLFAFVSFSTGCKQKHIIYTPRGYNITKPVRIEMGTKLKEISGISYVDENTMLANNDESGKIFKINLNDPGDKNYEVNVFGPKADYEDIVKVDSMVYVLISNGQIVEVPGFGKGEGDLTGTVVGTIGGRNNEFESMYYDKNVHSLVVLCKSCHKEKDQDRTAFRFDLRTRTLIDSPYFQISIADIRAKLKDDRAEFRPSAAAIHPIQNKLYIVSSIGKLLVITDIKGKVEHAIQISGLMFPQPEGITFAPNGDMYISNEAAEEEGATILKFPFSP